MFKTPDFWANDVSFPFLHLMSKTPDFWANDLSFPFLASQDALEVMFVTN